MSLEKKRISTSVKIIIAIAAPVFLVLVAFFSLGLYVQGSEQILPRVSIDGIDVSWLTKAEAADAIGLAGYDERGSAAAVTISFPDDSELTITGNDVGLEHDARLLIDAAFSDGRGRGFFMDTVVFIQRMMRVYISGAQREDLAVSYRMNLDHLRAHVDAFSDYYNLGLAAFEPLICDERIVIVRGAGHVSACEQEVFGLAYDGIMRSLVGGLHIGITYFLPDAGSNEDKLVTIFDSVYTAPLCAWYDPEVKSIIDCAVGVSFDFDSALEMLNAVDSGRTVSIDLVRTYPETTREYLEGKLFRDMIGETITTIAGTENRLNNVVLSSAAVDGLILEPGEEFSFNEVVGRRTLERGYLPAPAFASGRTIQAVGGGICQVSSSIFNAILDTDILVTERRPHGQPVAYLPRGRDATVSWGTIDFRFVNNTIYPLRIDAEVYERTLTVRVYGTYVFEEPETP